MNFSLCIKLKALMIVLTITAFLVPQMILAAPSSLVIDEFQLASKSSAYDEYFRITNVGATSYPLTGLTLRKITSGGTRYLLVTFDRDLSPKSSIIVTHAKSSFATTSDYTYANTSFVSNSAIYIYDDKKKSIVDLVAFGNTAEGYLEGSTLANPTAGDVYTRANGVDTDDNTADFEILIVPMIVDPNAARLVISELLPSPATGEEWFELYNPTSVTISLQNLKICDALGAVKCYDFVSSDYISAGSYKIYLQSQSKITLNNTGDWLELYDAGENLLTDSGGDYGDADKGVSLAVFGTQYKWTKTITPGYANVYTDVVEVEVDATATSKKKSTKSRVVAKNKASASASADSEEESSEIATATAVKGAKAEESPIEMVGFKLSKRTLGWVLIGLAILLVLGYTLWYFRDYAKEIYHKIRPGDDSARF